MNKEEIRREKNRLRAKFWRETNPELVKARIAKCWADPEKAAKYIENAKIKSKDPIRMEKVRQRSSDWYAAHKDDEEVKAKKSAMGAKWRVENPHKNAEKQRKRTVSIRQRTPEWVDMDMGWLLKEARILASLRESVTGVKWHIDHIVPLKGDCVSGLHVPYNIQVVPREFNLKKQNKFDVDVGPVRFIG